MISNKRINSESAYVKIKIKFMTLAIALFPDEASHTVFSLSCMAIVKLSNNFGLSGCVKKVIQTSISDYYYSRPRSPFDISV